MLFRTSLYMTLTDMIALQNWPWVDEHHPGLGGAMEDWTCSKCGYTAPNKTDLGRHQRLFH